MKFESVKDEDVVTNEILDVKEPKQMDICLTWKKIYKKIDLRSKKKDCGGGLFWKNGENNCEKIL